MAHTTAAAIADYFIWLANETGSYLSNLKLQKLVYYAQAWHLGIYGQSLFDEDFEAWIHGPVIPGLYQEYKSFGWKPILKNAEPQHFSQEIRDFLEELTEAYFGCDAFELEQMTHHEDPWIKARGNLSLDTSSNAILSKESMRDYYKTRAEAEEE
ncbi:MAG: type II toxin-antitoxin system antitoxin SocA domain-containing protein [Nostoc sp.]|uniref:Panacea domain-containing protein n=1 Tax=Nostoc sp. TaxID=1180 RepID=UPI002FF60FA6